MSEQQFILVEAAPTFNLNLRYLVKKYRSIRNDIQHIIEQLERGELPGDKISGTNYAVFKLREEYVTVISKKEKVVVIV
jgi:hypothetical protein